MTIFGCPLRYPNDYLGVYAEGRKCLMQRTGLITRLLELSLPIPHIIRNVLAWPPILQEEFSELR